MYIESENDFTTSFFWLKIKKTILISLLLIAMSCEYEKHQRDYPLLSTSIIMDEFFKGEMLKLFPFIPGPIYVLIEDGILYHFMRKADYKRWPNSWLENNGFDSLKKYKREVDKKLKEYRKFLKEDHSNLKESLLEIDYYLRYFLPVIMLGAYLASYGEKIDEKTKELSIEIRKRYEDVHKSGMDLHIELLKKLEKEIGIKIGTLKFLTFSEFENFLNQNKLLENIEERKNFFLVEYSTEGERIFKKKEQAKDIFIKIKEKTKENISEIKGSVAFSGKIKGKVKLIRLLGDAHKLQEGDILVTSMTDPRYVPIMKKAGAIITDEGGVTCHAAIVSRELKIPCIVGTKIATEVLKDGDLVEVNANKGLIKIIK